MPTLGQLNRQVYAAGEVVFQEGEVGDCAYIIEDGRVEICVANQKGERQVNLIGKGEMFGEIALIDHQPRTATVRATEKAVLIPIQRKMVEGLLEKTDPIVRHLLLLILERYRGNRQASHPQARPAAADGVDSAWRNKLRSEATQKLALGNEITRALSNDEFALHYQPICDLTTGRVAGFEALIRWFHPTLGLIPPMDYLWLAENTGQIRDIGIWTLERACLDWPNLRRQVGQPAPFVSVNLSANQLTGDGFVEDVSRIINRYSMPPTELKLELTETVIINNPELAHRLLGKLTELGCRLALDDYGTGYSGLNSLQRYPVSTVKIDIAFINTLLTSPQSSAIVRSSIRLAHSLGMDVIAEGVETEEIRNSLLNLNCNFGQGWYFGRPAALTN